MNPQSLQGHEDDPPSLLARADISGRPGKYSTQNAIAPHKAAVVSADNATQASQSIALLHIPPELVTQILLYLSPHDIISSARTCRMLYDLCNCPALRYIVQMERCGVNDDMRPGLSYPERLRVLENREEAWATLNFRRTVQVSVPSDSTTICAFTGGTLLYGKTLDPEGRRVAVGYSYVTLPSLSDVQGDNLEWICCILGTKILYIELAVHEHDLIAALTVKEDVHPPSHAILEIRLLSFSTGQPHPLAEQPTIFIDKKVLPLRTWGAQTKIVGDFLILLITFTKSSGNKDIFFLVRWKSGLVHCLASPEWGAYRYFAHLSQDTLVIPNLIKNTFEVAKIVIDGDDTPRLVPLCVLNLPPLSRNASLRHLFYRAELSITGSSPIAIPAPSNRPFHDKAEEAIIVFHMSYDLFFEPQSRSQAWFALVVQRRALFAHIPAVHRACMPFFPAPEPAPPLVHVGWSAWGPSATRWSTQIPSIMTTAGQRAAKLESRKPSPIIVQDFNPYVVRAARALATSSGQSQEGDRRILPNGNRTTLKVEGSVLAAGSIFKEAVWSFLPYVEIVTQREYDYDCVMIDEERILGLKTHQEGGFETSSFDVHVLG